jgi:hypothetical protein
MPKVSRYVQTLNKVQQTALKRVFDRAPIYPEHLANVGSAEFKAQYCQRVTYRQFRKTVRFAYGDCAMVHWCGMWLGIEQDGYTHS